MTKSQMPENPDVVMLPNDVLQLTLTIDKINVEYEGVKIEGKEATYEARREASYQQSAPISLGLRQCSRAAFVVPIEHAAGYAIGSTVTVTISKQQAVQTSQLKDMAKAISDAVLRAK